MLDQQVGKTSTMHSKKNWHCMSRMAMSARRQQCRDLRMRVALETGNRRASGAPLEAIHGNCVPCSSWAIASPCGRTEPFLFNCWGPRRCCQTQCKLGIPHVVALPTLGPCCKHAEPVTVGNAPSLARSVAQWAMCPFVFHWNPQ